MHISLTDLGWSAAFLSQLEIDEIGRLAPMRAAAIHRDRIETLGEAGPVSLSLPPGLTTGEIAVGDWLLADPGRGRVARLLARKSLIHRRAAGTDARDQLIAANVDTLAVVSSMNAEFSPARLERYLALAREAGVVPVIVLTKADLCADPAPYRTALAETAPDVASVLADARDPAAATALAPYCGPGQTLVLAGSSGVGKSTLASTLTGDAIATRGIREGDAKGRHTTTARAFHRLAAGGWLIDTPGMRALRLAGVEAGIDAVFADVAALAGACRFADCAHESEPGCAVQAAIAAGELAPDRLARWQKLRREDARNSESIAEARARSRAFGKMAKRVLKQKPRYDGS